MSEYQYYEWLALDTLLTDAQVGAVERLSSHMDVVTEAQAVVTYSYGDFKHDPLKVLVNYFDAFLYAANWGARTLAFRFPKSLLTKKALSPYLLEDVIELKIVDSHWVLSLKSGDEGGGDWVEAEGMLNRMADIRRQISNRDYRALYLLWLAETKRRASWDDGDDDDDIEGSSQCEAPPAPAGLKSLGASLSAFCGFFEIDRQLVSTAAKDNPAPTARPMTRAKLKLAVAALSRETANDYLLRLLSDEPQLGAKLRQQLDQESSATPTGERRVKRAGTARKRGA